MTIQNLAMMYAMNVGIEALQGKRGSNLWKDAFKDTALMASMQGFAPDKATEGIDKLMLLHDKGPRGTHAGFEEAIKRQPNVVKINCRTIFPKYQKFSQKVTTINR